MTNPPCCVELSALIPDPLLLVLLFGFSTSPASDLTSGRLPSFACAGGVDDRVRDGWFEVVAGVADLLSGASPGPLLGPLFGQRATAKTTTRLSNKSAASAFAQPGRLVRRPPPAIAAKPGPVRRWRSLSDFFSASSMNDIGALFVARKNGCIWQVQR